jgi:signal transduction histidine kinase
VAVTAGLYLAAFDLPVTFAISLVTVWAALRFSVVTAELHAFLSGTTALLLTLRGVGVFADVHDRVGGAALAQAFLIVLMVTAAVVGLSALARREATDRAIRSEHTAAERARLLDTVMDNMAEGLVVVQEDGKILVRNPAGRELLGLAGTHLVPDVQSPAAYGLHQVDGTPLSEDELPAALAFAGHEVKERDYLLRSPAFPEGRILEMSATHIPDTDPASPRRVIINFRDVTLARQDRDNLASFAGVVAHDLLNPLSIVDGWAEALAESFLEGPVDPEDGAAMVTRILNGSRHMRHFIDDLLDYAVARDHAIQRDDVDLSLLVEDVASLRRQNSARPRIHVQEGLEVNGDASMLRQLFDNLIGNAVKYVAPGVRPQVIVGGRPAGDLVRITIDDNGIGVPAEQRRNVFETFQRVATDYTGTGLGLAICARIVGRHGGTISIEDNPQGVGSRFTLTLPAVVAEPVEPALPTPTVEEVG